jgi:hypothetical protein
MLCPADRSQICGVQGELNVTRRPILRGRPDASLAARLLVHLARFAALVVGLLVAVELILATWGCLEHIEYVKALDDVVSCATAPLLIFIWWQLATEIYLMFVIILASAATLVWAWRDRRRS